MRHYVSGSQIAYFPFSCNCSANSFLSIRIFRKWSKGYYVVRWRLCFVIVNKLYSVVIWSHTLRAPYCNILSIPCSLVVLQVSFYVQKNSTIYQRVFSKFASVYLPPYNCSTVNLDQMQDLRLPFECRSIDYFAPPQSTSCFACHNLDSSIINRYLIDTSYFSVFSTNYIFVKTKS